MKKHIEKGDYGYARKYKNIRILLTIILFLCIVADVVLGLVLYQTKRTLLTILACVMSLPFAKAFISYLLCVRFTPLKWEEYSETEKLAETYGVKMMYDISVSDTDGMFFYPCLTVTNNNIISYVPDADTQDKIKEYTEHLKKSYAGTKYKLRIVVTSEIGQFEKELGKLHEPKDEQAKIDRYIAKHILELGV